MKIETVALDDQQTRVIAEVEPELLEKYRRQAARKIAEKQKFPGFRPGKAPYDMVRRVIGDESLTQEAVEMMLDEVYPQALKEAGVTPSGPGKLEEIVKLDPPTFAFVVPLPPVVELGDYSEIRKEYEPEPITDEQIENTIRRLRRSYSTAEPVERAAQVGDLVAFTLSADRINPEEGEEAQLVAETPYQMVAGEEMEEENDAWPYIGFTQELIGLSADDTKEVRYTFTDESPYEDLRGKEVQFNIKVQNIKEMHLPELDDEFAQSMGDFENLEALRGAIRKQLEQNYQQQYDQNYFDSLVEALVEKATVKFPPHMLEEETEQFLHTVQHNLEHDRLDLDTYLKMREMDRETFMQQEVKPAAQRRLIRSLVLEEFAKQEKVSVRNEEIQSIYYNAMQQMQEVSTLSKRKKNQQDTREMANSIAVNAVNSIFNQRLMQRLKAIATGKGDEPVEEAPVGETALEADNALREPAPEEAAPQETVVPQEEQAPSQSGEAGILEVVETQTVGTTGESSPVTGEQEAMDEQAAAEADLIDAEPPQADLDSDNRKPGES